MMSNGLQRTISWMRSVLVAVVLCSSGVALGQTPEVIVELNRSRIYEGESVLFSVLLNHFENPKQPQLAGFEKDFDVQFRGSSSQRSVFNGRLVRNGVTYQFVLTPKRSGSLVLPEVTATNDGEKLTSKSLTLDVVPPEDQDLAILELEADRTAVYPLQPFTIKLRIAVKGFTGDFSDHNPLLALRGIAMPALSIPWVNDETLPDGIQASEKWEGWLGGYQDPRNRGGFSVNGIGGRLSFFDDRPLPFLPKANRTTRKDDDGNDAPYWEFEFARKFSSRQLGRFAFGPVSLKGTFVKNVDATGQAETEDVYAIARPLEITVKNPPEEGRPASYTGAIGEFQVATELVPTKAKVGDPMTLTMTIRGQGTLENAVAPDLAKFANVVEQFRIYDKPTGESSENSRQFTYSLRPEASGEISFPAIPFSYFDVKQEKYVTLKTDPIPLSIAVAQQMADNEIAMAASPGRKRSIEAQGGLLANITNRNELYDQSVNAPAWFITFGCMAGLFIVVTLVSDRMKQYLGDKQSIRRRGAPQRARQRLREAKSDAHGHDAKAAADHVQAAIIGLVADVLDIEEAGLATGDVESRLVELQIESDLAGRTRQLLAACDSARYGASDSALEGLGEEATELVEELVKALKTKKLL